MSNPVQQQAQSALSPIELATEACQSIMETYSPEQLPLQGGGITIRAYFWLGCLNCGNLTGKPSI